MCYYSSRHVEQSCICEFAILQGWQNSATHQCVYSYLFTASMLLFVIATSHVAVALRQLIIALTDKSVTSVPGGSIFYFLNQQDTLVFASQLLYVFNVSTPTPGRWQSLTMAPYRFSSKTSSSSGGCTPSSVLTGGCQFCR